LKNAHKHLFAFLILFYLLNIINTHFVTTELLNQHITVFPRNFLGEINAFLGNFAALTLIVMAGFLFIKRVNMRILYLIIVTLLLNIVVFGSAIFTKYYQTVFSLREMTLFKNPAVDLGLTIFVESVKDLIMNYRIVIFIPFIVMVIYAFIVRHYYKKDGLDFGEKGVMFKSNLLNGTILGAFAFSRIDFKGRDMIFSVLLMTMMIPGEIYIITNFTTVSRAGFGWIGTGTNNAAGYFATMIFPMMVSVFYIFFLRQSFKQIPDALYRAAKVDGCSDFKFLRRVMLPIASPTLITITILNILGTWSAFIWPRLITSVEPQFGKNYWLISVALREESYVLESGADPLPMFNLQIAASAIVTVPLVIVFLLLRKYIMSGVGRSGTKG
jgi:ABC-type glycerol-3-phosphate transport system permease component